MPVTFSADKTGGVAFGLGARSGFRGGGPQPAGLAVKAEPAAATLRRTGISSYPAAPRIFSF